MSEQEKARIAIREVLDQDKLIGQETAKKVGPWEQYVDGSALVGEAARRMDAIDLSRCPQDFQIAYKPHTAAWKLMATTKASNEGINSFLKGFFTLGIGVYYATSQMDEATKQIQLTWLAVQESAIRNGVTP